MKKLLVMIAVAFTAVVLAGCASAPQQPPETRTEYVTQYVTIEAPANMYCNERVPAPPGIKNYMALATWEEKEEVLMASIAEHQKTLGLCLRKSRAAREYVKEQKEIYLGKNQQQKSTPANPGQ